MSELDRLKEQLVYLRLWLGIVVVAEISIVGWLASAVETASVRLFALAIATAIIVRLRYLSAPSPDPASHRRDRKVIEMDILVGIVMLAVALLFVGIALHAAYHK